MKRVKIHWEREGVEDYITLEGETDEDIRTQADAELLRRGIIATNPEHIKKYNLWSEDVW